RPYPVQYARQAKLKDGTAVTLRPVRPEDEPMMIRVHQSLSQRSGRVRFFSPLKLGQRIAHERLVRACFNDYDREMALVAERKDTHSDQREILGIGRLSKERVTNEAQFGLLIHDQWQNRGLGTLLLQNLIQIGRDEKLSRI